MNWLGISCLVLAFVAVIFAMWFVGELEIADEEGGE